MTPLSETDVQRAFAACLNASPSFRHGFLTALNLPPTWDIPTLIFKSARQSIHTFNGETDVQADWQSLTSNPHSVLCEFKLDAGFMPRQGERYRERAEQMVKSGIANEVVTVLVAHSSYLKGLNTEARFFEKTLALDHCLSWIPRNEELTIQESVEILRDATQRMSEGKPFGAKGLHVNLYDEVIAECDRRRNKLWITNRPTDWIYLKHPTMDCNGVNINYRVREAVPEIRIWKTFAGDRDTLIRACASPIMPVPKNSNLFLRLRSLGFGKEARQGKVTSVDVSVIVDACEWLADWWTNKSGFSTAAR